MAWAASAARTMSASARAVALPVGDVGRDGVVEEHHVLGHERDLPAQALERERLELVAVEGDAPVGADGRSAAAGG